MLRNPIFFCDFSGGGGGGGGGTGPPVLTPSGSAHDLTMCFNAINLGLFIAHNEGSISLIIVSIFTKSAYSDHEMFYSMTIHYGFHCLVCQSTHLQVTSIQKG